LELVRLVGLKDEFGNRLEHLLELGLTAGDLILDTTNDDVYRYITGTTYVNMTADS
jgi:hypothetical protein